jgi:hypothetical protein
VYPEYSSTLFKATPGPGFPPTAKAAVCVPKFFKPPLAVFKFPAADHALICTNDFNVPDVELYHTCPSLPVLSVGSEPK